MSSHGNINKPKQLIIIKKKINIMGEVENVILNL